jgi:hypothetical protein
VPRHRFLIQLLKTRQEAVGARRWLSVAFVDQTSVP